MAYRISFARIPERQSGLCFAALVVGLAAGLLTSAAPAAVDDDEMTARSDASGPLNDEPYATGWAFYIDNDFLSAGLSSDQGYTGGFALSLSGRRASEYPWSLDPALAWIDQVTGWRSLFDGERHSAQHSWQVGALAFTPDDIDSRVPLREARPYAGLVFVGNTRQVHLRRHQISYLSSLSLGALGTKIPEAIQNGLHDMADDDKARGWDHQISAGGEPTFLWEVQRRQTHWSRREAEPYDYEVNSVVSASLGYSTQASIGLTGRWGDISTPWWSFNPAYSEYINLGAPGPSRSFGELYLWGGVHLRQQFYNAFLEGQFRDSEVTFDRPDDLKSTLWEANIGATWGMSNGFHVTLALRERDNELRQSNGREAWGSLIIGQQF